MFSRAAGAARPARNGSLTVHDPHIPYHFLWSAMQMDRRYMSTVHDPHKTVHFTVGAPIKMTNGT